MMTSSPAIILNQINKIYPNGTQALQDINLTVNNSEFVSLIGSSGCGKSTLLRAIAELTNITSGTIVWGDPTLFKQLAFVFQEPALMPWTNLRDNVRLPLKLAGVSQKTANREIQKSLELVGLNGFAGAYPFQLSGGMKMRASIARCLVTKPKILLMDEPFGALDEITRSKLNYDLLNLKHQNDWTVIFVTHNIYEAVYLSNRVIVMANNPGRIVAEVAIDAPYPRNEEFRTSLLHHQYCQVVATKLAEAMSMGKLY
jgi:NitT/TauT family transport system ATP-binding protein